MINQQTLNATNATGLQSGLSPIQEVSQIKVKSLIEKILCVIKNIFLFIFILSKQPQTSVTNSEQKTHPTLSQSNQATLSQSNQEEKSYISPSKQLKLDTDKSWNDLILKYQDIFNESNDDRLITNQSTYMKFGTFKAGILAANVNFHVEKIKTILNDQTHIGLRLTWIKGHLTQIEDEFINAQKVLSEGA